jgi:hypothetical protein
MPECHICFWESDKLFSCSKCGMKICKNCIIKTIETYQTKPICLGNKCQTPITYSTLYSILGPSYLLSEGFDIIVEGIIKEELSLFDQTYILLEKYKNNVHISKKIHDINYRLLTSPEVLSKETKQNLNNQLKQLRDEQSVLISDHKVKTKKIFCPDPNCGKCVLFLKNKLSCSVGNCLSCNKQVCMICEEEWKDNHCCSQEKLNTLMLLEKDSKPCPKCNIPISKVNGCDHMFCVNCHTPFDWETGTITRHGLNPHYYELLASGRINQIEIEENQGQVHLNRWLNRDLDQCVITDIRQYTNDEFFLTEHHKILSEYQKLPSYNQDSTNIELIRDRGYLVMGSITQKDYKIRRKSKLRNIEFNKEIDIIISTLFYVFCEMILQNNFSEDRKKVWNEIKNIANIEIDKICTIFGYKKKII